MEGEDRTIIKSPFPLFPFQFLDLIGLLKCAIIFLGFYNNQILIMILTSILVWTKFQVGKYFFIEILNYWVLRNLFLHLNMPLNIKSCRFGNFLTPWTLPPHFLLFFPFSSFSLLSFSCKCWATSRSFLFPLLLHSSSAFLPFSLPLLILQHLKSSSFISYLWNSKEEGKRSYFGTLNGKFKNLSSPSFFLVFLVNFRFPYDCLYL